MYLYSLGITMRKKILRAIQSRVRRLMKIYENLFVRQERRGVFLFYLTVLSGGRLQIVKQQSRTMINGIILH